MPRLAVILALTTVSACLSAPPGSSADGGSTTDQAEVGNLLFFTFDDYRPPELYRDHSGNRFHAYADNSNQIVGVYGSAINVRPAQTATVEDHAGLFELPLTIEMWVRSAEAAATGALFGDGDSRIEILVHLVDGQVALSVNSGIEDQRDTVVCAELSVTRDWSHIAVTWDGLVARFYGGAELACELELVDRRVELIDSRFYLGGTSGFDVDIDELKVSNLLKGEKELARSMSYDSSTRIDLCGDGFVITGASECEPDAPCCSASCELLSEQACSDDAGNLGECTVDGLCASGLAERVAGAIALYYFDDSTGGIVTDMSGGTTAADLRIIDSAATTQMAGFLRLNSATGLVADQSTHLIEQLLDRGELSVEAWVRPDFTPLEQATLPRRIATLSPNLSQTNFTLGQAGTAYVARIQYQSGPRNGHPVTTTGPDTAVSGVINHVVATFTGATARIYLNGRLVEESPRIHGLGSWSSSARLQVGNEIDPDDALLGREWLGDLHLVALYDRALSPVEVAQNYLIGPDPELP